MKKLKLNLDELKVESFDTTKVLTEKGTVNAQAATWGSLQTEGLCYTCAPSYCPSCGGTCPGECPTENNCTQSYSCGGSCAPTCETCLDSCGAGATGCNLTNCCS